MTKNRDNSSRNEADPYQDLRTQLNLLDEIPFTRHWSAAADFLRLIVDHSLRKRPRNIVECGSGLTTLMLARCCEKNSVGHLYSLENGSEFAQRSRQFLNSYQLQEYATVLDAPLSPVSLGDESYQWYRTAELPDEPIDMLVIDGPPAFIHDQARYPALPLLFPRMSPECVIFLDDAARGGEQKVVERWLTAFPKLAAEYVDTERGCSILRINGDAQAEAL